jgi:hypothetical protein
VFRQLGGGDFGCGSRQAFLIQKSADEKNFHRVAERNEEQNIRTQEQSEDGPLRKLEFKETAENPRM